MPRPEGAAPGREKKVLRAAEQLRPDVQERRARWLVEVLGLDPAKLVFIDETACTTAMTRRYGRAPRGQRLYARAPWGHWKTTTSLAALRTDGLHAPSVIGGALNGAPFPAWVRQELAPTLKAGDVVIMDNLACHKAAGVREAIEAAGAKVAYLPPYSPEFNPIGQVFAKLKGLLRKAEERTVEGPWQALGRLLDQFSPEECGNDIRHCGYAATSL